MMEFLYFPEDKTKYIPAVISLILFFIGATITMYIIYKASKKEEKETDKLFNIQRRDSQDGNHKKDK
ncbi:hypothetical protein [Aquibacillus rhizosphaerae]|uniref:Uncharacterized protein n=1 Tax=Aquibacillus rhizosphaerae TaxID=3051431 RepID=A0ABT7L9L2_9BACI|nr:hypothetical protein [Aquibacillus sp. LR5S19]MDL4842543.1 hypothetical protein [Aquibacillus sp. LR5S19]